MRIAPLGAAAAALNGHVVHVDEPMADGGPAPAPILTTACLQTKHTRSVPGDSEPFAVCFCNGEQNWLRLWHHQHMPFASSISLLLPVLLQVSGVPLHGISPAM